MPAEQPPADDDAHRSRRDPVVDQFAQAAAHAARQPDRDRREETAEVLRVVLPPARLEPRDDGFLAGPHLVGGARTRRGPLARDGPREEYPLRGEAVGSPRPWRHEAHDGVEHPVGRHRVLPVHPQLAPCGERYHDGAVLVDADPGHVVQAQRAEPGGKQFLGRRAQAQPGVRRQRSLPAAVRARGPRAQTQNGRTARTCRPASASAGRSPSRHRCAPH